MSFPTKSQFIYNLLKKRITNGEIFQGETITISDVAAENKMSPIPVREALKRLESEGLVDIVPHKGASVTVYDEKKIDEVMSIRGLLEGYAARCAVDHIDELDLNELYLLNEEITDFAISKNDEQFIVKNRNFHDILYSYSNMPSLVEMIHGVWEKGSWSKALFAYFPEEMIRSAEDHKGILDAISNKEYDDVEKLMRKHKESSKKLYLKIAQLNTKGIMMGNFKSENWWASPYNESDEYLETINLPKRVEIHDSTLRDGEQTPGVVFSIEDKIEIAKMLDDLGVERIEAGMPAVSDVDKTAIKEIASLGLKAKIFTFARAMKEDIDLAIECGAHGVVIETPLSVPKLTYQFSKWNKDFVINRSVEAVKYAKESGLIPVFFGYDNTRSDYDFMMELYSELMENAKPYSIGIVDTMGCILPGAAKELVKKLKSQFDVKFEIHTHNDFGFGSATSFAAMEGGAEVIHTSINGMGERTGNAALEQILLGLRVLYGIENGYKYEKINQISKRVQEISNFYMPVNKPVVGDNIFVRESGIGVDLVLNKPLAMFATNPAFTGHSSGVVLGKKSGLGSIKVAAEKLHLDINEEKAREILSRVKETGMKKKSTVTDQEFKEIVKSVQG